MLIVAASLAALELIVSVVTVLVFLGRIDDASKTPTAPNKLTDEARLAIETNISSLSELSQEWLEDSGREEVRITSYDGAVMKADLVRGEGSDWVILMHGYVRSRAKTYNYGRFYALRGYNVLMPDMRGHEKSGGAFIGMGWLDRLDIKEWINSIVSRDSGARIILHGISMGAAAAMMTAGEQLPENVKAVIEDCGYTSVWDEFSDVMRSYTGLPDFPLMYTASAAAKLIAGYSYSEASALEQIKKSALPILFIHGECDTFVKTEMVRTLYAARPDGELFTVPGAGHGQAMYIDPDAYFDRVFEFADKYMK